MALHDDILNAKKLWLESSALMRCFIGFSVFLSVSSVASLSKTLIEWKGFIKDGLDVTESLIYEPLQKFCEEIAEYFGVDIFDGFAVCLVLFSLCFSALLRSRNKDFEFTGIVDARLKAKFSKVFRFVAIVCGLSLIPIASLFAFESDFMESGSVLFAFIVFVIISPWFSVFFIYWGFLYLEWMIDLKMMPSDSKPIPPKDALKLFNPVVYAVWVVGVFTLVGILGAFNTAFLK
jgi:hypothetical protein